MSSICNATSKESHTRHKARAHLHGLRVRKGYSGQVYWCRHCGGWHVGSRKGVVRR
jgi:hypothetical protein